MHSLLTSTESLLYSSPQTSLYCPVECPDPPPILQRNPFRQREDSWARCPDISQEIRANLEDIWCWCAVSQAGYRTIASINSIKHDPEAGNPTNRASELTSTEKHDSVRGVRHLPFIVFLPISKQDFRTSTAYVLPTKLSCHDNININAHPRGHRLPKRPRRPIRRPP